MYAGPVGTLQAFPTADVTDVVMDFIAQVKPNDLVQIEPLAAMKWREVERIVLPPQQRVHVFEPVDMRVTRWELYQDTRHVPVMRSGKQVHTILLPWHVSMDNARHRVEEHALHNMIWLLSAASPENWIVHNLPLPGKMWTRWLSWSASESMIGEA